MFKKTYSGCLSEYNYKTDMAGLNVKCLALTLN